jgi:hypothetical protein
VRGIIFGYYEKNPGFVLWEPQQCEHLWAYRILDRCAFYYNLINLKGSL